MGYSVEAYLVDLDQLRQVYGSHDLQLVRGIERQLADELLRLNDFIAETNYGLEEDHDPNHDGELILCPNVNASLRAYVAGTILLPAEYSFSSYRFALKLFCGYLGTAMPDDMFQMLRPFGVGFIEHDVPAIADVVFRSPPLGPVPFPDEWRRDWHIGHISWERAAEQLRHWQTIIVSDDPENRAWEQGVCDQYRGWLEEAVQQHKGIVTFFD
jgi:hypothetical protein